MLLCAIAIEYAEYGSPSHAEPLAPLEKRPHTGQITGPMLQGAIPDHSLCKIARLREHGLKEEGLFQGSESSTAFEGSPSPRRWISPWFRPSLERPQMPTSFPLGPSQESMEPMPCQGKILLCCVLSISRTTRCPD